MQHILFEHISTKLFSKVPFVPILMRVILGIMLHSFTGFDSCKQADACGTSGQARSPACCRACAWSQSCETYQCAPPLRLLTVVEYQMMMLATLTRVMRGRSLLLALRCCEGWLITNEKSHHPCLVVCLLLRICIRSHRLVVRINTCRNLGGIETHGMQGGLENSLVLVQCEQVLLGHCTQPIHA